MCVYKYRVRETHLLAASVLHLKTIIYPTARQGNEDIPKTCNFLILILSRYI